MSDSTRQQSVPGLSRRQPCAGPPCAADAQVWLDFDGTITIDDTLDQLLAHHTQDESWKDAERLWQQGRIGSFECLSRQLSSVRISAGDLRFFLDGIAIDTATSSLFKFMNTLGVPFAVLSDGIDSFIAHIFAASRLDPVVRANSVRFVGSRLELVCPHRNAACESGAAHCKCRSGEALSVDHRRTIYIGDGRSDLCPSRKADYVFAKGALANHLEAEGIAFERFDSLADVVASLRSAWLPDTADNRHAAR